MNTIKMRPPVAAAKGDRSFWPQSIDADAVTAPLHGSEDCAVAIVGGGYAGLWTALRIKEQAPQTRVTVLEADFCESGASGRNGGHVHSWFAEMDMLRAWVVRRAIRRKNDLEIQNRKPDRITRFLAGLAP
jgi:glycine/D-amino acid oxidase-like deaminating enzyme